MSYILEALKKAQAERQLGNAPTIHAPQPAPVAQPALAGSRRPLFVGLGAGALVVLAGVLLLWQRAPAPAAVSAAAPATLAQSGGADRPMPAPAPAPASATAPADVLAPSGARAAASNTLVVSAPPSPSSAPAHPAEAPAHPAAVAASLASGGSTASAGRAGEAPRAVASAPAPAAATAPAPAPRAAAASPAPEDSLPFLQQLPDGIQRELPRVSFGGYMYSSNPADRLLLVDKTLRHEGEEVAPGLVLEKLLPKAAVMNYRGTRYRVAY